MTNVDKAAQQLGGKVWRKHGIERVYLEPDRKDQKVYIDYDDVLPEGEYTNYMQSGRLVAFTDCPGQSTKYNINASKQVKYRYMLIIAEQLGLQAPSRWEDVIL